MEKFNEEQLQAINADRSTNVIISAGAGSGKTSTLSEKVHKLIAVEGIDPSRILVLTFTNKAAYEMKERIIKKFEDEDPASDLEDKILSSHIQTFDSAFLFLVRRYNRALGLPKNISIGDETIIDEKKKEYIRGYLDEQYERDPDRMRRILSITDCYDDSRLYDFLVRAYDFYSVKLSFKEKKKFLSDYSAEFLSDDFFKRSYEDYVDDFKDELKKSFDCIYIASKIMSDSTDSSFDWSDVILREAKCDQYEEHHSEYEKVEPDRKDIKKDPDFWLQRLVDLIESTPDQIYEKASSLLDDVEEFKQSKDIRFTKYAADVKEHLKEFVSLKSFEEQKRSIKETEEVSMFIIEAISCVEKELSDFKRLNNIFTFNDIKNLVLELLTKEEYAQIREEIVGQFDFILVDEYQDTNDDQEEFLRAFEEGKKTIFTVGDAKQAIYGFRDADLELFKKRKKDYAEKNDDRHQVIEMNKNYRSTRQMIDGINKIFGNYMSENHGGLDYGESERLIYGGYSKDKEEVEGPEYGISLLMPKRQNRNHINKDQWKEDEAVMIANDIREKVSEGEYSYKDFAILIRKKDSFSAFIKIFDEYGIPYNVENKTSLLDKDPIYLIQSLLKLFLSIRGDDEKKVGDLNHIFLSIARSYIYFGPEEAYHDDEEIFSIVSDGKITSSVVYTDMVEFVERTEDLKASEIFLRLVRDFKVIEKLPHVGDASNLISKIDSFYQILLSQENLGQGLKDFSDLFASFNRFGIEVNADTTMEIDDAVTIETIHASKGLEYRVVYMPVINNDLSQPRDMSSNKFSKRYGFIIKNNISLPETYLNRLYKKENGSDEDINEHVRLFYVALTRAKESLIIAGGEYAFKQEKKETLFDMLRYTPYETGINENHLKEYEGDLDRDEVQGYRKKRDAYKELQCSFDEKKREIVDEHKLSVYEDMMKREVLSSKKEEFEDSVDRIIYDLYKMIISHASDDDLHMIFVETYGEESESDFPRWLEEMRGLQEPEKKMKKTKKQELKKKMKIVIEGSSDLRGLEGSIEETEFFYFPKRYGDIHKNENTDREIDLSLYDSLKIDDEAISYKDVKARKRASKVVSEDTPTDETVLKLGTRYHKILELIDLRHPDYSFIEDAETREVIKRVLNLDLFKKMAPDTEIYKEYEYFDEDNQTTGSIDLLLKEKDGTIKIIDYKLSETTDEAYLNQLSTYKTNVKRIFDAEDSDITCYLLSIYKAQLMKQDV